jgi:phosphoribosyl 1,2-cyclic phosphate phosphodiesterase
LKITFLGTGTSHGVPMIGCDCETCRSPDPRDRRLRPSVYIETPAGGALLVDAGPDLRVQALAHDIRRVDAILFTHGHADHILGIDDVRRFNTILRRPMPCYADPTTVGEIRTMFGYAFDPATPKGGGLPQLELRPVDGAFRIGGDEIVPVPVLHGTRPILGFRIGALAYLTDCSRIPDASWPLLQDLDVVVLDALRERPHSTHFSIAEAVEAAGRIGARRTYFTHMCHDVRHAPTCARLPDRITLAHDGLVVEVSDRSGIAPAPRL